MALKGKHRKGHVCSEETKRKLALANIGKKHTLEARQKMSESHKGKTYVMSEECKRKIGAALKGRKHTEQARKNMSLGRLKAKLLRETGK